MGQSRSRAYRGVVAWLCCAGCATGTPSEVMSRGPEAARAAAASLAPQEAMAAVTALETRRASPVSLLPFLASAHPPQVRARAALALARAEHLQAIEGLMQASIDPDPRVRANAYFGLGQLDLAFDGERERHRTGLERVEARLVEALTSEADDAARRALVRALGRVARARGLTALAQEARQPGPWQADALYSLGVAAVRRPDDELPQEVVSAVREALRVDVPKVLRAAAYAAFRLQRPISRDDARQALSIADPQTRLHLARARWDDAARSEVWEVLLQDEDWQVRVVALQALGDTDATHPWVSAGVIESTLLRAIGRLHLAGAAPSGEGHVAIAACRTLAAPSSPYAPQEAREILSAAVRQLNAGGAALSSVTCRCAAALAALEGISLENPSSVEACGAESWSRRDHQRVRLDAFRLMRVSTRERARHLQVWLSEGDPALKIAAIQALMIAGAPAIEDVIGHALLAESEPAVAAEMLRALHPHATDEISTDELMALTDRFLALPPNFPNIDPLIELATVIRTRPDPRLSPTKATLRAHADPRVRDAMEDVPHGERSFGPRASDNLPLPLSELPLAAIMMTSRGPILLHFLREDAPLAVANFATLARAGFLDRTRFHRVMSTFVVQGGDPRGDGAGGPAHTIPCENTDRPYRRGSMGMALAGKDTGGSQFFFTYGLQPHLDGKYTLFAKVVEGLDVMDALHPEDEIVGVRFIGAVPAR